MNEIHIYSLELDLDPALLDDLYDLLNPEERVRAARFRAPRHRNRFIARRGMLRQILSRYAGETPPRLQFVTNRYGKPALDRSSVRFNLSHSSGRALVAVTNDREVGVDLERIDAHFAIDQIPEQFFSRREVAALRALPESQQKDAFFRCWCRKEAYIKARGYGLSLPLDSFAVSVAPGEPAALLHGGSGWSLQALDLGPGFAGAVAARGSGWRVVMLPFAASPGKGAVAAAAAQTLAEVV
jgi:4'-phosphopantetheinyl transferase